MRKWYTWLLFLTLSGVGVSFALFNQIETIVIIPGVGAMPPMPLYIVIFVILFVGYLFGLISGWYGGLRQKQYIAIMEKQIRDLEQELVNLRNLPLDDELAL